MYRRHFLACLTSLLTSSSLPAIARHDPNMSPLRLARIEPSYRQAYLDLVAKPLCIEDVVYDHDYSKAASFTFQMSHVAEELDPFTFHADLEALRRRIEGNGIFLIHDNSLFGLGYVGKIYVGPAFFKEGFRYLHSGHLIKLNEVDASDHLQVYRYQTNTDVEFALAYHDHLRRLVAEGVPESGFGYGALNGLSQNDEDAVFTILGLEAHARVFPRYYSVLNSNLSYDVITIMKENAQSVDSAIIESLRVRRFVNARAGIINKLTSNALRKR